MKVPGELEFGVFIKEFIKLSKIIRDRCDEDVNRDASGSSSLESSDWLRSSSAAQRARTVWIVSVVAIHDLRYAQTVRPFRGLSTRLLVYQRIKLASEIAQTTQKAK